MKNNTPDLIAYASAQNNNLNNQRKNILFSDIQKDMEIKKSEHGNRMNEKYLDASLSEKAEAPRKKFDYKGLIIPVLGALAGGLVGGPAGAFAGLGLGTKDTLDRNLEDRRIASKFGIESAGLDQDRAKLAQDDFWKSAGYDQDNRKLDIMDYASKHKGTSGGGDDGESLQESLDMLGIGEKSKEKVQSNKVDPTMIIDLGVD